MLLNVIYVYVSYLPSSVHVKVLTLVTLSVVVLVIILFTVVVCVEVYVVGSVAYML